jgi:hypothetical protein
MRHAILVAVLAAVLATTAVTASSAAAPAPRKVIASHCSASGDVCYGIVSRSGAVYFELTTAARYFLRYRLCVRPPAGAARCRPYSMRPGRMWMSAVKFGGQFPHSGRGVYRVTWRLGSSPLGPTLRFRLPLQR